MSIPVILLPEAQTEFDDAVEWYEDQAGLSVQFVRRIQDVLSRIGTNPRIHRKVFGEIRRAVVRTFPYVVMYREDGGQVVVLSVFHTSRDPAIWQSRA